MDLHKQALYEAAYANDQRAVQQVVRDTVKGTLDFDLIDDITQDAWARAWEALDTYNETKSSFLTWVCNVAKSVAIDYIKSESAQKRPDLVYEHMLPGAFVTEDGEYCAYDERYEGANPCDDPALILEAEQEVEALAAAGTAQQRLVLQMRLEGYSNPEIAEQLGTSVSSVENQISKLGKKVADSGENTRVLSYNRESERDAKPSSEGRRLSQSSIERAQKDRVRFRLEAARKRAIRQANPDCSPAVWKEMYEHNGGA